LAYGYNALLTLDHTLIGSDESNYAFPVVGTYDGTDGEPDLRTVANGGHVQNTANGGVSGSLTVPADCVFAANDDGSSPYDFEWVDYNPATGYILAWVEVPALTSGVDPEVHIAFGDSGVPVSQEDVAGTWNSSFAARYHLAEASGNLLDSTGNGWDLTAYNGPTYGQTGKIGDCLLFDDASNEYLQAAHAPGNEPVSLAAWVNTDTAAIIEEVVVVFDGVTNDWLALEFTGMTGGDPISALTALNGGALYSIVGTTVGFTTGTWYLGHAIFPAHNSRLVYRNGGSVGTNATTRATDTFTLTRVGALASGTRNVSGYVDEVAIWSAALDADYVATDYNAQNAPASFYSMGAEQALSAGVIAQLAGVAWASVGQIAGVAEASIAQIAGVIAN